MTGLCYDTLITWLSHPPAYTFEGRGYTDI